MIPASDLSSRAALALSVSFVTCFFVMEGILGCMADEDGHKEYVVILTVYLL